MAIAGGVPFCEKGVFPGFGLIGRSQPNTLISFIYKGEDFEGGVLPLSNCNAGL